MQTLTIISRSKKKQSIQAVYTTIGKRGKRESVTVHLKPCAGGYCLSWEKYPAHRWDVFVVSGDGRTLVKTEYTAVRPKRRAA